MARVHPNSQNVARLTMLPMFGEVNAIGLVLKEEDEVKLSYLTFP